ncbi:FecR domain-containing protein [Achromobacter denitrificans]|uniref:FecR domain-containing protein n=1 Tax=Achromobacter denitrificans TaxID=32002 RepID=A0A6N0JSU7_ACHDE|nr:FecR domain-containing protein [Achromobacter denitrificans]
MGFDRAGVSPGAPGARAEDGAEGAADRAVLDEAIRWRIKLQYNTADASAWQAFDAWLRAQPAHALVWERLQALGARLQRPAAEMPGEAAARILRQTEAAQVRRSRRKALMSLGALAAGGWVAWRAGDVPAVRQALADVSTSRGERRRVTLPDGGTLVLNTETAVDIDYGGPVRRIRLLAGEVYVISGHDPLSRPLFVETRDGRAQALGTRYRVRQWDDGSEVAVDEGAVALLPRDGAGEAAGATLRAGESARMTPQGVRALAPAEGRMMDGGAWVEGALSVRDMPLDAFLQELSRYHGAIECDPAVARLPVSGVFQLDDTRKVLALLRQILPVEPQAGRLWWGGRVTQVRARARAPERARG